MKLSGKVALITGASRGIGSAIALALSKNGASVIINYSKDEQGAQETLRQIQNAGGYAAIMQFDIRNNKSCSEAADSIYRQFGRIDILINNAGISRIGLFMDFTEEDWNTLIDTNLKGTFNMTHSVLKYMAKVKSGSIVNISSIWGVNGASCETVYSATKGAIISFTKALAREMGPSGIRVNALAPGVIDTGMNNWLTEEEKAELTEDIPLCTMGDPMDIGNAAAFLCSDESRYITGQTIIVDGGFL